MARRTSSYYKVKPPRALDTLHVIPIIFVDGTVWAELLIYGLTDKDIYIIPNDYVSQALNNRQLPLGVSVSPFMVRQVR